MIRVKQENEIGLLREGGHMLAGILRRVADRVRVGVSTGELDAHAEELIRSSGGIPSFKGYQSKGSPPYPAALCTSINDEVVHGIPRKDRILRDGDIIGLDIGMLWPARRKEARGKRGLYTDMAVTVGVGSVSGESERLIRETQGALDIGIHAVRAGATVGDVGAAIEAYLKKGKFGIIRDLAGHGVGYEIHEDPLIPNFGKAGEGARLRKGMVIAIEPMATLGRERVVLDDDGWTFRTADGSRAAHFEHTLVVTKQGAEILTI